MTAPPLKGERATCLGKHRHPDEVIARAAAMHALKERPELGRLYVYRCPTCRGWHLTRSRHKNNALVTANNPVHE